MRYPMTPATMTLGVLMVLATACAVGPDPANIRLLAASGRGVDVRLALRPAPEGERIVVRGELLTVDQQSLLVLREADIARVRWVDVDRVELDPPIPERRIGRNVAADAARLQRVQAVSRFPQGVTPPLLERLVDHYGPERRVGRAGTVTAAPEDRDLSAARSAGGGSRP